MSPILLLLALIAVATATNEVCGTAGGSGASQSGVTYASGWVTLTFPTAVSPTGSDLTWDGPKQKLSSSASGRARFVWGGVLTATSCLYANVNLCLHRVDTGIDVQCIGTPNGNYSNYVVSGTIDDRALPTGTYVVRMSAGSASYPCTGSATGVYVDAIQGTCGV